MNELMELKNYVNYLIEIVLIEKGFDEVNDEDIKYRTIDRTSDLNYMIDYSDKLEKKLETELKNPRLKELEKIGKDVKLTVDSMKEYTQRSKDLQDEASKRFGHPNNWVQKKLIDNKKEYEAELKRIPSANQNTVTRQHPQTTQNTNSNNTNKNITPNHIDKNNRLIIGGGIGAVGLGVAGYTAYKLAKKRKLEKEKANKK